LAIYIDVEAAEIFRDIPNLGDGVAVDGEASEGARGTGAIADEAVVEDDVEIRLAVGSAGNESQSGEAEQERAMHHIRLH
jgi:hypothetical protein